VSEAGIEERVRSPRTLAAWAALETHAAEIMKLDLRQLFAQDAQRGERFAFEAAGIYFDYSKNRITEQTLKLLVALAREAGVKQRIDAMFAGEPINVSENRAVLHVALRAPRGASFLHDGRNVVPDVHAVLEQMGAFSNAVRGGAW
jgi:glucose-6-phosphate isomerase